jgi:hypothetical protein
VISVLFLANCQLEDRLPKWVNVRINDYSIFDSALYRNRDAEWIFPFRGPQRQVLVAGVEVKATLHDLQTSTCESKML